MNGIRELNVVLTNTYQEITEHYVPKKKKTVPKREPLPPPPKPKKPRR